MFGLELISKINGMEKAWIPAVVLLIIALIFGILIVVLSEALVVKVDPKIGEVREHLAGANCGACGYAGCDDFAKALCEGKAEISSCSPTSADNKKIIAGILGVVASTEETKVVVKCNGGSKCKNSFAYTGYSDCKSAASINGGFKSCSSGCLGLSTCTGVCPTNAIVVNEQSKVAKVDQDKCINCGICISNCPKSVIVKVPVSAKVLIACTNKNKGKDVKSICDVGCIACGICVKNCPEKCMEMKDNLPVIDYSRCTGCKTCVAKCPCHTIIEL